MRKWLAIWCMAVLPMMVVADDVKIDKENCIITKNGKTYPLYGKVVFVEDYPDITIKFVEYYADIEVKITESPSSSCCEWKIVGRSEYYPDLRVKIDNDYPDITVKVVESYPHIRRTE
ncbi:MAG: hypothetical protein II901_04085 [Paludibacteraceae bacterium]|nr:hypothetical protein [Paludibacteraceae bacterium]MBQ6983771.1 hypothetical protein [Paludibacteraceae bacterium]MBQ6984532.1 hypothetical protein [Paludibacteraceae bacterium]